MKIIRRALLSVIVFLGMFLFVSNAYAEETNSQAYSVNDVSLYSNTNTYDYKMTSIYDIRNHNEARYDLSGDKNGNVVSNDNPLITVFTHGWDGNASTWGNIDGNALSIKLLKYFFDVDFF